MTTAKQQTTDTRRKVTAETRIYREAFHGACERSLADIRQIAREASIAAESILKVEQRAITGKLLDEASWTIWGYCRVHLHSLESTEHCKKIREILDAAVAAQQVKLEATQKELRHERARYHKYQEATKTAIQKLEFKLKEPLVEA